MLETALGLGWRETEFIGLKRRELMSKGKKLGLYLGS
jgi:hypothetical protein